MELSVKCVSNNHIFVALELEGAKLPLYKVAV